MVNEITDKSGKTTKVGATHKFTRVNVRIGKGRRVSFRAKVASIKKVRNPRTKRDTYIAYSEDGIPSIVANKSRK